MTAAAVSPLPNIHSLSDAERRTLVEKTFAKKSRFQTEFSSDAVDLDCAQYSKTLKGEVVRLLEAKGVQVPGGVIEKLHETIAPELKDYNFNDGVNKVTTLLYDTDDAFAASYHAFVKSLTRHFPYPFYFQATPTIRIHCPGGANANHYPRYHTDIGYGHPPEEINLWIPLTEAQPPQQHGFRRTTVKHSYDILSQFDFDFAPFIGRAVNDKPFNYSLNDIAPQVVTKFGQFTAFDSRCIHTGEPLEKHTRASMDIRIIPVKDFEALEVEYQGTGRRRMRYVPGHGYHILSSDKL